MSDSESADDAGKHESWESDGEVVFDTAKHRWIGEVSNVLRACTIESAG